MKLTKNIICKSVADKYNLSIDYVELQRFENIWYWGGKAGSCFIGREAGHMSLNNWNLERWVEDFDMRVEECLDNLYSFDGSFKEYIDRINWSVEYE